MKQEHKITLQFQHSNHCNNETEIQLENDLFPVTEVNVKLNDQSCISINNQVFLLQNQQVWVQIPNEYDAVDKYKIIITNSKY